MKKLLIESMQKLDFTIWAITLMFFVLSAMFTWGDIQNSFIWASWIIVLMFFIGFSIELILSALKNVKWIWAITWFITNWPEALVLIVWLIGGNILFAASTPLWSNLMNPILLFIWLLITREILNLKKFKYKWFFLAWFLLTLISAVSFFFIPEKYYIYWIFIALLISLYFFFQKYDHHQTFGSEEEKANKWYLPLWIIILLSSWYFLDPVVSFTAEVSNAPKWIIWFLVLSTLTSWPEFKSLLALFRRKKFLDSFINILVSNIVNIWLAVWWVAIWLFMR